MSEKTPEGKFPFGKQARAAAVEANRKKIEDFLPQGVEKIRKGHYDWVNSSLDSPTDGTFMWGASFADTFGPILPEGVESMREYIEGMLSEKKGHAIGIEFGGIGSALFSDFTPGFFEKSLGVTLVDHRQEFKPDPTFARDERIHHTVHESDIFSPRLTAYLDTWLGGRKVDFVIERMAKGLEFVPEEPLVLAKKLQEWWSMLEVGGIMMVQVPVQLNSVFEQWAEMVRHAHSTVLDLEYSLGTNDGLPGNSSVLRVRKLPGAPEMLPVLDARAVRDISKKNAGRGV